MYIIYYYNYFWRIIHHIFIISYRRFFAIKRVLAGYHFFIFGYWISNYDNIKYFFNKERVFTCNLILFLILFYISINLYSNELFRTIYRIPITLSIYYIIKNANLSRFTKPFEYLGKTH